MMKPKAAFLGLFIIILGLNVYAQQYNPLVIENAQWRVEQDDDGTPWLDAMLGWLLRGDTIINEQQYKKLYRRVFEDPSSDVVEAQWLYGFLREDTVARIVYALETQGLGCDSNDQEYILFDFSYEIGDTSYLCLFTGSYCIVENTYYENEYGADRKIFIFWPSISAFIEGIGHQQGLLESPIYNISGGVITSLDDYCVGTDEECGVLYVKLDEPLQTVQYHIYPNPFDKYIKVESAQEIKQIIIHSISGEIVKVVKVNDRSSLIEASNIKAGMYFLEVFVDSQQPYQRKLIKINSL